MPIKKTPIILPPSSASLLAPVPSIQKHTPVAGTPESRSRATETLAGAIYREGPPDRPAGRFYLTEFAGMCIRAIAARFGLDLRDVVPYGGHSRSQLPNVLAGRRPVPGGPRAIIERLITILSTLPIDQIPKETMETSVLPELRTFPFLGLSHSNDVRLNQPFTVAQRASCGIDGMMIRARMKKSPVKPGPPHLTLRELEAAWVGDQARSLFGLTLDELSAAFAESHLRGSLAGHEVRRSSIDRVEFERRSIRYERNLEVLSPEPNRPILALVSLGRRPRPRRCPPHRGKWLHDPHVPCDSTGKCPHRQHYRPDPDDPPVNDANCTTCDLGLDHIRIDAKGAACVSGRLHRLLRAFTDACEPDSIVPERVHFAIEIDVPIEAIFAWHSTLQNRPPYALPGSSSVTLYLGDPAGNEIRIYGKFREIRDRWDRDRRYSGPAWGMEFMTDPTRIEFSVNARHAVRHCVSRQEHPAAIVATLRRLARGLHLGDLRQLPQRSLVTPALLLARAVGPRRASAAMGSWAAASARTARNRMTDERRAARDVKAAALALEHLWLHATPLAVFDAASAELGADLAGLLGLAGLPPNIRSGTALTESVNETVIYRRQRGRP